MATPNSFETVPTNLNDLQKYLDIATEYETIDLTVSYWCHYYALKKGSTMHKFADDQGCQPQLKEWLSKYKQKLKPLQAITDSVTAQHHLERVALNHFNWADMGFKFFATNQFVKIVIETLDSTETLLDVCSLFWGINEELAEKKILANLNAAVLKKRSEVTSEIEKKINTNSSCVTSKVTIPPSSENPAVTYKQKDVSVDQSSAGNPSERKTYDRLFLLNLRYHPASQRKPLELLNKMCFRGLFVKNRDKQACLTLAVNEILNGLTSSNIYERQNEIEALLTVDTEERLLEVSKLLYEQALSAHFVNLHLFARMCSSLSKRRVSFSSDSAKTINELLLAHCMADFDRITLSSVDQKKKELQNAETKEELKTKLEEHLISKRKSIRNMRFIGELFKVGHIVSPKCLNRCICRLLSQTESEDSLEYLCQLLTTVGKEIEFRVEMKIKKAKWVLASMYNAFNVLESIVTKNEISHHIRCKIQKVIDLRNHNWIHKKRDDQAEGDSNKKAKRLGSLRRQTSNIELQSAFENGTGAAQVSQNNCCPIEGETFSVLLVEQQDADKFLEDGVGVDKELAMPVATKSAFFSTREDHLGQDLLPSKNPDFHDCSSGPQYHENSVTSPDLVMPELPPLTREMSQDALLGKSTVTKEDIEHKSHELLSTFFTNDQNIENAVLEMKEWLHPTTVAGFICQCLLLVYESRREERRATSSLIKEMVKRNLFSLSDVKKGYTELLQMAEDWIVRFPNLLWESAVELVEPLFEEGEINLQFLSELSLILKSSLAADFVAAVLKELVIVLSVNGAERLWVMSNASLASVLPSGVDPEAFLIRHKELEFLSKFDSLPKDSGFVCAAVPALPNYTNLQYSLEQFLKNASELTDDEVHTWIQEQNFGEVNSAFIRALTTAVVESSIEEYDDSELNPIVFNRWTSTLLRRYVDNITDRELEVLFAVQSCLNKRHNLGGIVRSLLDSGVVSESSWELWFSMNIYFACE